MTTARFCITYWVTIHYEGIPRARRLGVLVPESLRAAERERIARNAALDMAGPLPVASVSVERLPGRSFATMYHK